MVDETECDLDDVREKFGQRVAKLVSDVSTLGKLPQILRRYQRRGLNVDVVEGLSSGSASGSGGSGVGGGTSGDVAAAAAAAAAVAPPPEDVGRMEDEELAMLRKLLLVIVDDPRVYLIKIADRLHNMRTMYAVNPVKVRGRDALGVACRCTTRAKSRSLSRTALFPKRLRRVRKLQVD